MQPSLTNIHPRQISWTSERSCTTSQPLSNRIASFHDQPGIIGIRRFTTVAEARQKNSLSVEGALAVRQGRDAFRLILHGDDKRIAVVTGPCSVHDVDAALEYAARLKTLSDELGDRLLLMMRVYFEKPRTSVGWKGLVSDPHLDDSNSMEDGVSIARRLLCDIADLGVPSATEFLDPLIASYLGDLVSWVAIGARTTESQTHRQMASGLSAPVGFKNCTGGSIDAAVNAITAARRPHTFPGVDDDGFVSLIETAGNSDTHVILRGARADGKWKPNYSAADISQVEEWLTDAALPCRIMVDCSHANCGYDFRKQAGVAEHWIAQRLEGNRSVFGLMFESNLHEGRQTLTARSQLKYGVSVTDPCIGWAETEDVLRCVHAAAA
ncbi:MAG TPA: 3-deoxy-7-phosphoheptulonate synthase [Chthoniobacterales bacterium]